MSNQYIILATQKGTPEAAWQFDPQMFDTKEAADRRRRNTVEAYAYTNLRFKVVTAS